MLDIEHTFIIATAIVLVAFSVTGSQCEMQKQQLNQQYGIECIKAGNQLINLQCVKSGGN